MHVFCSLAEKGPTCFRHTFLKIHTAHRNFKVNLFSLILNGCNFISVHSKKYTCTSAVICKKNMMPVYNDGRRSSKCNMITAKELTYHFPKVSGEIHQCSYDEIVALAGFLFHLELIPQLLEIEKWKLYDRYCQQ